MNTRFPTLLLFALCVSCTTGSSDKVRLIDSNTVSATVIEPPAKNTFREFIGKFKPVRLPLSIDLFQIQERRLPVLYGSDSAFISSINPDSTYDKVYAYGILPDTAYSFKVIWLSPAEVYVPKLTTFSKDGKKISEDYLGLGKCGSDCCFTCNETVHIYSDYTVYAADSIKSCECDSLGPNESTMRKYVLSKTAKIEPDGKFTFSEEKETAQ